MKSWEDRESPMKEERQHCANHLKVSRDNSRNKHRLFVNLMFQG